MPNNCLKHNSVTHYNTEPLVSVRIHNYNYGRYLRECIDSALSQTYSNVEISFSDNASTDESWEIVLEYQERFPLLFNIARNRINFGPDANISNCIYPSKGKYSVQMCSDDTMEPQFLEKCVRTLESNPECAYVMVHRGIIDDNGIYSNEPPFYNCSCIIPGEEQAAVYMMAAVNPSISQIAYVTSRETLHRVDFSKVLAGRWYGARIMDFNLCCQYPVAYINEPLLNHRLHGSNDSQQAAANLIEILGPFLLYQQFAETAETRNIGHVTDKLIQAQEKLGKLCLRYCARFLIAGNRTIAEQYYYLAVALFPAVKSESIFETIRTYWHSDPEERATIVRQLQADPNLLTRQISYDPPSGSKVLFI